VKEQVVKLLPPFNKGELEEIRDYALVMMCKFDSKTRARRFYQVMSVKAEEQITRMK
jgi:hypothetical protein